MECYRQLSLPSIKFTGNQVYRQPIILFFAGYRLPSTVYRQILSGMVSPSPGFIKNECFFFYKFLQFQQDQIEKKRERATQVCSYKLLYGFVSGLLFLNKQTQGQVLIVYFYQIFYLCTR